MSKMKKLVLLFMVMVLALAFVACGEEETPADNKTTPTTSAGGNQATPTTGAPEDTRDLKGLEVVIADWWTADDYNVPKTTYEEEYWAFQDEMMKAHNYTIVRKNVATWSEMTEQAMLSISTNQPLGSVIVLDSGFVASLLDKGLFADVSDIEEFDFKEDKWNKAVLDVMTVGDAVYGFAGSTEPRTGVFFNMDLFKELGVDAELPYDLQAAGQWTWDEFKKLAKQLTQDTNNDGQNDVYGIASFSSDFFQACLLSNDTDVIVKDEDGNLMVNTSDPAVLEALDWGRSFYDEGLHMPKPEGDDVQWDWFVQAFQEQKTAMRVCEEYNVSSINQYGFKFGFVCFPQGPSAESMISIVRENILVIPKCDATKNIIGDIAYAYNIFTDRAPGAEDDDTAWKGGYEALFTDERAVNETLDYMINKLDQRMTSTILLSDYSKDWVYDIDAGAATPAEQMEAYGSQWQTMVDDFNAKMN